MDRQRHAKERKATGPRGLELGNGSLFRRCGQGRAYRAAQRRRAPSRILNDQGSKAAYRSLFRGGMRAFAIHRFRNGMEPCRQFQTQRDRICMARMCAVTENIGAAISTAANRSTFAPATRAQHDPEHPLRQDVFGITFRVDLVAGADSLTFVLHRGDSAETGPEQALVFTTFGHEVWQLEGAGSAESLRGSTRVGRRPPRANGSRPDKSSAMGRTRARRARPARSAARIP